MISFSQYIIEKRKDPINLGQRVAKIFGKRKISKKWEKADNGEYIPLSSFDSRKVAAVATREQKIIDRIGPVAFDKAHTNVDMKVSDLVATQPFVRVKDVDKLKSQVSDTHPTHIRVVTYKGLHYIDDGHHAVMAAKLRGNKYINVSHVNLDEL